MSLLPSRGPDVSTAQEGEMQVVGVDDDVEPLLDALASDTARTVLNAIYDEPGTPSQIADRLDMSIQKISYHLDKLEDQDLIAVAGTRYSEKGQEMKVYEPPEEPLVLFVGTEERKSSLTAMVKRLLPTVGVLALGSVAVHRFFDRSGDAGLAPTVSSDAGQSGSYSSSDAAASNATTDSGADVTGMTKETGGQATGATPPTETAGADAAQATGATPTPDGTAPGTPTGSATETAANGGSTDLTADGVGHTPTEAFDAGARATEAATGSAGLHVSPGVAFFLGGLLVLTVLVAFWAYRTYA